MTHRLYYTKPSERSFDASVVEATIHHGRPVIRLDSTAFYPTSGGQPFDTGTLTIGEIVLQVVDVYDDDDGEIAHVVGELSGAIRPGQQVHGEILWSRRFDHMQQHTGQHLLSAAFERLFGVRTVSFHLGSDICTIDLAREANPQEIAAAEAEASRVVWEDRPIAIRFVTAEEAARLPLRKEPVREGLLRLIDIEDFDLSACGGTHVERTGAVGIVVATGWERFKGGQRLEFVCGGRALARFQALRAHLTAATRRLSVLPGELGPAIERLQNEARELQRARVTLQSELARYRSQEMLAAAERTRSAIAVCQIVAGGMMWLKLLATAITAEPGRVAVLVSSEAPAGVVVAASAGAGVAANQLLNDLLARFGGRGGGKADLAQGGGLSGSPDEIAAAARALLSAQ